ncbi:MAG TPA: D-beta-D-heptose 1-phosphate adenosyltransferase [Pseudonocardiaceae bacterium]|jgi:DeoR family fructose operon transcriptional repressor|nr:D-beta-D-heptose 1-phosphate adenosyltransferase [Pseudonocardiaceae bacterium]
MTGELIEGDLVMSAEKDRIAKAALAEVPNEGAILLDTGSTVARLAMALPVDRELTIVTNSISLAQSLCEHPNFTLMLLGGRIRSRSMSSVDSWVLRALADTYVDVAFIAADGVSVDRGLTTPDAASAMVKRAAIAAARRTVLLADHTKVGRNHLAKFADLKDIDTFITDAGLDPQRKPEITATGSRLVTA